MTVLESVVEVDVQENWLFSFSKDDEIARSFWFEIYSYEGGHFLWQ